jgi:hypothetical protein
VKKARFHTKRKVVNQQSTREDFLLRKAAHPFGSVEHSVIAILHLIAICHGKDRFSLKSKYFPNNSGL